MSWSLIIGGSSGLGLATAKKLAHEGHNLCIIHRDRRSVQAEIDEAFEGMRARGVKVHSFNLDALRADKRSEVIQTLVEDLSLAGRIQSLIYSVAKGNLKPMRAADAPTLQNDDFHLTLETMAIGLYDWTKALYEAGLFTADARVISFTSEGNQRAWPNYAAVSAAKAALEAITRNIALEFAPVGIRANCVQAGVTDTPSLRMIPGSDRMKELSKMRNPFGRLTTPEDVANVVYLLCTPEAAWINGAIIPVDGGERIS
jgi:enoyl-[acyl-carrier protein] reductase I